MRDWGPNCLKSSFDRLLEADMDLSVSQDRFLDGGFSILQFRKSGHRSGLDAITLAATVPERASGRAADLGAGCGAVGFAIAHRCPSLQVDLFEIDPQLTELCIRSAHLQDNIHFANRVHCFCGNVERPGALMSTYSLEEGSYSHIVANPPFNDQRYRPSPDERRARAHVADETIPENWIKSATRLCIAGGKVSLIIRPANLSDWIDPLRKRFGGVSLMPVHPSRAKAANRLLIGAMKGSRAALRIMPPLFVHETDGGLTRQADDMLRGRSGLDLFA